MHELSVAQRLLERAVAATAEHDVGRVEELTIEVGRATHLNPDQLRFCIETLTQETPVEGATVTVETVEPSGQCECGWAGSPDTHEHVSAFAPVLRCPNCDGRIELDSGRECRLASITVPERPGGHR